MLQPPGKSAFRALCRSGCVAANVRLPPFAPIGRTQRSSCIPDFCSLGPVKLPAPLQREPIQQIIDLQLRPLPPVEDRLHNLGASNVSRKMALT
jgi:hypothetical protein